CFVYSYAVVCLLIVFVVFCVSLVFVFFFYCCVTHRYLHSFPTRRSSDLIYAGGGARGMLLCEISGIRSVGLGDSPFGEKRCAFRNARNLPRKSALPAITERSR